MELAKVINKGDTPIILRHQVHGDVTIQPGKERIVSIYHIIINFGNPGARNEGKNKVRDADYANLRTRWGFYPGIHPEDAWEGTAYFKEEDREIGPFKPQFEVYDLDDNRIWTILDDPQGVKGTAKDYVLSAEAQDSAFVNKRIEQLEGQIAQLVGMLAAQTGNAAAVPESAAPAAAPAAEAPAPSTDTPDSATERQETQTERNEARDDVPKPTRAAGGKDKPKTTRVGA